MDTPVWADSKLSKGLPLLRARGEGQLEFKIDFPEQAHELAKDVAALATSGGGMTLVGVEDDGRLAGLVAPDGAVRDALHRRAQGIIDKVEPAVKSELLFAVEGGKTVLVIRIPKQARAIYMYDGRVYVRDDTVSRRATPDEIEQLVWSHPSSDFKRAQEQLILQGCQAILEESNRAGRRLDEQSRAATEENNRLMRRLWG
jgi:predicted HTH transcriptional regulator